MTNFAKMLLTLVPTAAAIGIGMHLLTAQTAGQKAEREYQIVVENGARWSVRCAAATAVADAYLQDENADQYRFWHNHAEADCVNAQLEG